MSRCSHGVEHETPCRLDPPRPLNGCMCQDGSCESCNRLSEAYHEMEQRLDSVLKMSVKCGCVVKAHPRTAVLGIEYCKLHGTDGDEAFEAMREALRCAEMWVGKLIADGGHKECVAPQHAERTLDLIAKSRALADKVRP